MFLLNLSPIAFSLFGINIYWYGILYAISLFVTWFIASRSLSYIESQGTTTPTPSEFDSFIFWAIIAIIIFSRLGHILFFEPEYYINNPKEIFMIRNGGLAFHGGFIGICITIYYFCKKHNIKKILICDVLAFSVPLGLFIGRIANFINQELYGVITNFKHAVIFQYVDNFPRHPTQIYESIFEGFLPFLIMISIFRFCKKQLFGTGIYSGVFCILYASSRFIIEFFKDVEIKTYFNIISLTVGQILCLFLFIVGVLILNLRNDFLQSDKK